MTEIEKLRAAREKLNEAIETMRKEAKELSAQIRELEGPIPDRSHREGKNIGFTIKPAG